MFLLETAWQTSRVVHGNAVSYCVHILPGGYVRYAQGDFDVQKEKKQHFLSLFFQIEITDLEGI